MHPQYGGEEHTQGDVKAGPELKRCSGGEGGVVTLLTFLISVRFNVFLNI